MADARSGREPAVNLPPLLTAVILILLAIHAGRQFVSESLDLSILLELAFVPAAWSVAFGFARPDDLAAAAAAVSDPALAAAQAGWAAYLAQPEAWRPFSLLGYALLHGSWLHIGLNVVWLAAFGSPVVRRIGNARSAVLGVAAALGGALAHWLAHPTGLQPVIGASAVVSGFMAAAATFVFQPPRPFGYGVPRGPEPASFSALVRNRSALLFLASWFVINVAFGLLAGPLGISDGGIAWEAHIGGLVVGLLLFPQLDGRRAR